MIVGSSGIGCLSSPLWSRTPENVRVGGDTAGVVIRSDRFTSNLSFFLAVSVPATLGVPVPAKLPCGVRRVQETLVISAVPPGWVGRGVSCFTIAVKVPVVCSPLTFPLKVPKKSAKPHNSCQQISCPAIFPSIRLVGGAAATHNDVIRYSNPTNRLTRRVVICASSFRSPCELHDSKAYNAG